MCGFISSVWNWISVNPSLDVAVVAVIVAVVVPIWGVRRTLNEQREQVLADRREREEQAIADQRYAIFQELDKLLLHYAAVIAREMGGSIQTAYSYDPKAIRRAILILLTSPTRMKKDERKSILAAVTDASKLNNKKAMEQIKTLHTHLVSVLSPEITKAMEEMNSQEG